MLFYNFTRMDFAEFGDITPVPLPQQTGDAFFIPYSDEYVKEFGIFNALLASHEISRRALNVCNSIVTRFSKHYSAWSYKCDIMAELGYNFQDEVNRAHAILTDNPKCYQAWHFMEWLTDREEDPPQLTPFLTSILAIDGKNFHGWAFAIWYAERWHQQESIYALALDHIKSDCRNNSAWSVRKAVGAMLHANSQNEFGDAAASLRVVGKNEAASNFLLAVARENPELVPQVRLLAEEMLAKNNNNAIALRLLLATSSDAAEISRICDLLMQADPLRIPYYTLVKSGVLKYK